MIYSRSGADVQVTLSSRIFSDFEVTVISATMVPVK